MTRSHTSFRHLPGLSHAEKDTATRPAMSSNSIRSTTTRVEEPVSASKAASRACAKSSGDAVLKGAVIPASLGCLLSWGSTCRVGRGSAKPRSTPILNGAKSGCSVELRCLDPRATNLTISCLACAGSASARPALPLRCSGRSARAPGVGRQPRCLPGDGWYRVAASQAIVSSRLWGAVERSHASPRAGEGRGSSDLASDSPSAVVVRGVSFFCLLTSLRTLPNFSGAFASTWS